MHHDETVVLRLEGLSKKFGGVSALSDVSFNVERGGITGLIGPNGSGKSTLINVVSALHRATSGRVIFDARDVTSSRPQLMAKRGLARTFQLLRVAPTLSVHENVLAATHLSGRHGLTAAICGSWATRAEERVLHDRADELVEFIGLGRQRNSPAAQLGAGQARLLELARALATDPKLLLLDEPAAGLNTAETAGLEERLRTLQKSGLTMVLVDHDVDLVMRLADRVVCLNQGAVLAQGVPAEVRGNTSVVEAYLGTRRAGRRRVARSGGARGMVTSETGPGTQGRSL